MTTVKLLIADDVDDNRLILRAICRKIEGLEIYEAINGEEAVEKVRELRPHIVLMDIMMPVMDGLEATKIIKAAYPSTVVIAVTAVMDPAIETTLAAIGVSAFIRKPVDKELIRFKLSSYVYGFQKREQLRESGAGRSLPTGAPHNVRPFKTLYTITSNEAIMDFGVWMLGRFDCLWAGGCTKIDRVLECIFGVIRMELERDTATVLTISENYEEMYIHLPLPPGMGLPISMEQSLLHLGPSCVKNGHSILFVLPLPLPAREITPQCAREVASVPKDTTAATDPQLQNPEKRTVEAGERQLLRESFTVKTTAAEYIAGIDGDTFGEMRDLRETEEEWEGWLDELAIAPTEENFHRFCDDVLGVYAHAISRLYEFSGLSYAITSLSALIRSHVSLLVEDSEKRGSVLLFLGCFKNDLSAWIEHLFERQDAEDIHYLDCSLYSSCMQIETIINGTEFDTGEEGEVEFF